MHDSDPITTNGRGWRALKIICLFGGSLAEWILVVLVVVHQSRDMRMWRSSCHPKVFMRDFIEMYKFLSNRKMDIA